MEGSPTSLRFFGLLDFLQINSAMQAVTGSNTTKR
jgi:hypothetical protein